MRLEFMLQALWEMEHRKQPTIDDEQASLLQISATATNSQEADSLPNTHVFREICQACMSEDVTAPSADAAVHLHHASDTGKTPISLADHLPKTNIQIDLKPAAEAFQWIDHHFILPCFDVKDSLPAEAPWHPASLDWMKLPWYAHDIPGHEI